MTRESQELAINSLASRLDGLANELYKLAESFGLSASHEAGVLTAILQNYSRRIVKLKERL